MSLSVDLLEVAYHLAKRERRRPKQASLRRSVSTSYYALFHLLTAETVTLLAPKLSREAIQKMQRWFDHREMKRVCASFSKALADKQFALVLDAPVSPDLQVISKAFLKLQEARHDADYNLTSTWTRLTAQANVQLARNAFAAWARIKNSHEASVFAFALLSPKLFERER